MSCVLVAVVWVVLGCGGGGLSGWPDWVRVWECKVLLSLCLL